MGHSVTPRWGPVMVGVLTLSTLAVGGLVAGVHQLPSIGAGGLLYSARRPVEASAPATCRNAVFTGDAVSLTEWYCRTAGKRRGTLGYFHGVADNSSGALRRRRTSGVRSCSFTVWLTGRLDLSIHVVCWRHWRARNA
jgi:hypothetical protein